MRRKFRCDCATHIIEVQYDEDKVKGKPFPTFWIEIYDVYSPKTGRKYKKPKPLGDVVLMNNYYPKELERFLKFMKEVIARYKLSKK